MAALSRLDDTGREGKKGRYDGALRDASPRIDPPPIGPCYVSITGHKGNRGVEAHGGQSIPEMLLAGGEVNWNGHKWEKTQKPTSMPVMAAWTVNCSGVPEVEEDYGAARDLLSLTWPCPRAVSVGPNPCFFRAQHARVSASSLGGF